MRIFTARVIQATLDAEIALAAESRPARPASPRRFRCVPSRLGALQIWTPLDYSSEVLARFLANETETMHALRTMLVIGHLSAETARAFAGRLLARSCDADTAAQLAARINGEIASYMRRCLEEDFPLLDSVRRTRRLALASVEA